MTAEEISPKKPALWRKIATGVGVVVSFAIILLVCSAILVPKDNQLSHGMNYQDAYGIMGEPEGSIDVVMIGDSLASTAFSPLEAWNKYGLTSYVCATNGQNLTVNLTLLNEALEKQKPKVVMLEASSLYRGFNVGDIAKRVFKDYFPVFEYHNRWKSLTWEDFFTTPKATFTAANKGYYYHPATQGTTAVGYMLPTEEVEPLGILNQQFIEQAVARCREEGVIPIIVATPSIKCWSMAKHNGMQAFAEQLDVPFYDLNTGEYYVSIDWATETRDQGDHLNHPGALKSTEMLTDILRSVTTFPNRKNEAGFDSWDEAYNTYQASVASGTPSR